TGRGRYAMTLGPIAFLSPWLLAGLLALPVIWWLLRTIPPRPRRIEFPPTRILVGIENREKELSGTGPVVLVVDNGWAAAAQWSARSYMIERLIAEAEGQSRLLLIAPTANATKSINLKVEAPAAARSTAAAIQPQPFSPDRMATAQAITNVLGGAGEASVVWLAHGVDHDGSAREFAGRLAGLSGNRLSVVEARP